MSRLTSKKRQKVFTRYPACVLLRGGTQVMLVYASIWAVHGATELRVFTVVAFCTANNDIYLIKCIEPVHPLTF